MHACELHVRSACGGQTRAQIPLELELQMVVCYRRGSTQAHVNIRKGLVGTLVATLGVCL